MLKILFPNTSGYELLCIVLCYVIFFLLMFMGVFMEPIHH